MFDDWREGIHGWVRQQTADLVDEGGIRLHDHIAVVNSSMAFGFNLFMPFREHGASTLEELLTRALGLPIRVVDIEFEFQGPTDVLAECAGPQPTDDEKFTASDVAVHVEDYTGRAGLVPRRGQAQRRRVHALQRSTERREQAKGRLRLRSDILR